MPGISSWVFRFLKANRSAIDSSLRGSSLYNPLNIPIISCRSLSQPRSWNRGCRNLFPVPEYLHLRKFLHYYLFFFFFIFISSVFYTSAEFCTPCNSLLFHIPFLLLTCIHNPKKSVLALPTVWTATKQSIRFLSPHFAPPKNRSFLYITLLVSISHFSLLSIL